MEPNTSANGLDVACGCEDEIRILLTPCTLFESIIGDRTAGDKGMILCE